MALSMPLYACGSSDDDEEIVITFNYNDNSSRPYYAYTEKNSSVTEPTTPTREGYQFEGWYTAQEGGTKVDFSSTFDSDVTLYAQWSAKSYSITFDYNYENSTPLVNTYLYGDTVKEPDEPTWDGGVFYYWQTSADGTGTEIEFPYTVTGDVTFYARWGTSSQYQVTFNANYDNSGDAQVIEVIPGNKIKEKQITKPTRSGYAFKGWATSANATESDIISLPYTPSSDVTLYAVWSRLTYKITFNYNYPDLADDAKGTTVAIDGGSSVDKPATDPTRPNYTFTGWYTSARGGELITFPATPTGTVSYYAHWKLTNAVETNIFDAEFTEINATKKFYGYSGSATGIDIIVNDTSNGGETGASTQNYPFTTNLSSHNSYYVTYQYEIGDELVFEVYSDKAVTGATLKASLATEIATGLVIGPTGDNAYVVTVNDVVLNYNAISFGGTQPASGQYKGQFQTYTLGNINLVAGKNIIKLTTNNSSKTMGGTMKAVAPMVDYIQIDATGATLSWYPIYDNIYKW
jgi:uncharacterized repeat protein (TIGR02543 family)